MKPLAQCVPCPTTTAAAAINPRVNLLSQRAKTPFVSKELGGNLTACDEWHKTRPCL